LFCCGTVYGKEKATLISLETLWRGTFFCGEKQMKAENVNRRSVRVSDDALYVSSYFLFYFSAFFISLRTFY